MAERAISVRLDEEAQRALAQLTRGGKSRSAAIRDALIDAARLRLYEQARHDAERLSKDPDDLAEVRVIQEILAEMHAPR